MFQAGMLVTSAVLCVESSLPKEIAQQTSCSRNLLNRMTKTMKSTSFTLSCRLLNHIFLEHYVSYLSMFVLPALNTWLS
jgi:negative regulator of sigma E activity